MAFLKNRALGLVAAILLFCSLLTGLPGEALAQPEASESDVKAAFLYNFTKFVEWPPAAFQDASSSFRLCVLSDEAFSRSLQAVVEGQEVAGRKLTLLRLGSSHDSKSCNLLFIGRPEHERIAEILASMAGSRALVVGESTGFLKQGGMINFHLQGGKVRFEVNLKAAEGEGLKISSKLLRLATRVL